MDCNGKRDTGYRKANCKLFFADTCYPSYGVASFFRDNGEVNSCQSFLREEASLNVKHIMGDFELGKILQCVQCVMICY